MKTREKLESAGAVLLHLTAEHKSAWNDDYERVWLVGYTGRFGVVGSSPVGGDGDWYFIPREALDHED